MTKIILAFLLAITAFCRAAEPANPSITLITDPQSQAKGLLIVHNRQIALKGEHAGQLKITILNYLEEEVFVRVTDYDGLNVTMESPDGGALAGGGGVGILFPDNVSLLKRLHASIFKDGQRFTCGCAMATIKATIWKRAIEFGPGKGHTSISISGFYRNTGKEFHERIDLPIELVEEVKDPDLHPATTKPAQENSSSRVTSSRVTNPPVRHPQPPPSPLTHCTPASRWRLDRSENRPATSRVQLRNDTECYE